MAGPAFSTSPTDLPDAELEAAITTLAASINAATRQWLSYIAELDRRETWGSWGVRSCAHWLNWQCGIAMGAAREKVRVARALETLPAISAAFAAGELSYSKVRAMSRVATPENEDYLLMIARHGTATHVEQVVRAYRAVDREEATQRANRAHETRACHWHYDDDGSFVLQARLPAEVGALFVEALAAAAESVPAGIAPGKAWVRRKLCRGVYVTETLQRNPAGESPARQGLATHRNRVLRRCRATAAAKRTQGICRLRDGAPK